jgi:hypothetical protein
MIAQELSFAPLEQIADADLKCSTGRVSLCRGSLGPLIITRASLISTNVISKGKEAHERREEAASLIYLN